MGTGGNDVFSSNAMNQCHVTLGGDDDIIDTSPSGLHAIIGGPGDDELQSGVGPAVLGGGDGNDILTSLGGDDVLFGQAGDDVLTAGDGANECHGGPGIDTIVLGNGDNQAFGGAGTDTITAGSGNNILSGGADADLIQAGGGNDVLRGDAGDDTLNSGAGDDLLIGGHGLDTVDAGYGDDTVVVLDPCELAVGEHLDGGPGTDTLRIPIPLVDLQAFGVTVAGFETIVVDPQNAASECGSCSCTVNGGVLSCCSDQGTCGVDVGDDQLACACAPGLLGGDCSYNPDVTFWDEPPPPSCGEDDPSCWTKFDADDECGSFDMKTDMQALAACDDLDFPTIAKTRLDPGDFKMDYCVYYPTEAGQPGVWANGRVPLWLFNAGNGFTHDKYSELLSHIARNGIAAVSMSKGKIGKIDLRGEMLACLRRLSPQIVAGVDSAQQPVHLGPPHITGIAYGGHSRGGEAAVVATMLDKDAMLSPPSAVVGLAPTHLCGANFDELYCGYAQPFGPEHAALTDGATRGSLVLEGSRDGDVTGEGLALNDLSTPELLDPVPEDALVKAMIWAFKVPHADWTGLAFPPNSATRGKILGKAYALAFLRWHLAGDPDYRSFFSGQSKPVCVARPQQCGFGDDIPIFPQFREGGSDQGGLRRVIRYFSVPFASPEGTGPVTPGPGVARADSGALGQREWLRGESVTMPPPASSPWIEFRLDGFGVQPEPLDSLSASLSVLSFRVAKVLPDEPNVAATQDPMACDTFAATQDRSDLVVRVTLSDADGSTSAALPSSYYRRVAAPDIGFEFSQIGKDCNMHAFWTTVRIPLTEFGGVKLDRLEKLRISIEPADNGPGAFTTLLDSVELVGHEFDPVCGNGVLDSGEDCEGADVNGNSCESLEAGVGVVTCTSECRFDLSSCGPPGEPGGPCKEIPTSPGVAAYHQDQRYCNENTSVCREDNLDVWTCHDCSSGADTGVGCPCSPNSNDCPPGLTCFGTPPELSGIDSGARGACWDSFDGPPDGFCSELCEASARICGSTVEEKALCLIPDCAGVGYCELQPGLVCDRDAQPDSECVPACDEFSCKPGQVCTSWGECWG